ncbi:ribosome maturation factor RimM [Mariniplasma anaerobium]|uniref:Ribosome maturation factor RimM n=1 Tax=Mariniplasma anaerobium TaxID=2735436 RepID=A0A7U9THH0_9MOLU|nr:ribosome maturation factor RimM [Mariniplasma anaerobium]BCR36553.1 ribosome maturation factor RimM [Mariniplasma anaerobium]
MYRIGKITSTHGIRGEVKIYNLSDFDRFLVGYKVFVMIKDQKHEFTIERVRENKNVLIVKFLKFDDINDILPYKGLYVYSEADVSEQLESNDYHYDDVIGKKVVTDKFEQVGIASALIEVPQGHLLEIEKPNGKKALVPFIKEFIGDIDDEKIVIKPIEGLL